MPRVRGRQCRISDDDTRFALGASTESADRLQRDAGRVGLRDVRCVVHPGRCGFAGAAQPVFPRGVDMERIM